MKKKKVKFGCIKIGKYFKFYRVVYLKADANTANRIIGKQQYDRCFFYDDMVIPVTIMITVVEKR